MSLKHVLPALGAAFSLLVPAADASAQQAQNQISHIFRLIPDSRTVVKPVQRPKPDAASVQRTATPAVQVSPSIQPSAPVEKPAMVVASPAPVEVPVKKVEPRPLTEEELAAKAAVDSLFEREPALAKARELPDPALVREAVRRHNEREAKIAAEKRREEAEAAKLRELEEMAKAREAAKLAAEKRKEEVETAKRRELEERAKVRDLAKLEANKFRHDMIARPGAARSVNPANAAQASKPAARPAQKKTAAAHQRVEPTSSTRTPMPAFVTVKPF